MRRLFVFSLLSAAGVLLGEGSAGAAIIQPTGGTLYTVNANSGADHTDPHVDGNLVAYSNSDGTTFTVHYYNLSTLQDATIPQNGGDLDFLSDVNGGRIPYTHVTTGESAIALYDTTTSPATQSIVDDTPGSGRRNAQIGGNNIAWEDLGFYSTGCCSDIMVYNYVTQTVWRLTDDGVLNQSPAISSDGNVIAWVACATVSSPCAVDDAVYANGSWTTNVLTTDGNCSHPDTNGVIVAYTCTRNGSDEVYFQPVGGGTEQEINWGGQGETPSVAGNFISFSGEEPGATNHQLYVARLTAGPAPTWDGNLYQITNGTSDVQLNDTTVGSDGSVTVVWQQQDAQEDVFAFTFTPEGAQEQISSLGGTITSFGLPHGLTTSLLAKLNAAQADYQAGDTALVCSDLQALINEANAQSGKGLSLTPVDQASAIINAADAIRQTLGC